MTDLEVGELWQTLTSLENQPHQFGKFQGDLMEGLIRKLVEERASSLSNRCMAENSMAACARRKHDHEAEAITDFGIPEEGFKP